MAVVPAGGGKKIKLDDLINPNALRSNVQTLSFLRTYVAVILGITVGILGITGWHGFVYHYAAQIACAAAMVTKGCRNPPNYFHTWNNLLFNSVLSSTTLLSYILFWMILYNLCHVF